MQDHFEGLAVSEKDNLKDLADPFIDLANSMTETGAPPEYVGTGSIYGAARYAAFLTLLVEELGDRTPIQEQIEVLVQRFREALEHHLEQHPIGDREGAEGMAEGKVEDHEPNLQPSEEAMDEVTAGWDHMAVALESRDVLLTSYLRGSGRGTLADTLTWPSH